jgi:phage replication initiation protein
VVGPDFDPVEERGRGLYGWRRSFTLGESGALMGIGGQRGKAFLSLSGAACARIPNYVWPTFIELIGDTLGGRITRWDGAVDDYEGIHGVDWAVSQYQGDGFHTAGNKPKCKQSGNWLEPDGSGRTFYVGARRNGKMMRIYDKGKQLGDPDSPWTRWELELHNTDREIPWDVLLRPGQYVAGAYRCTDWISKESCRIRTHKRKQQIAEEVLTANAKRSYGKYINYLLNKYQDPVHVLNLLRREGIPARLSDPEPTD